MKSFVISEDVEIVADGQRILLEKGDKIVINEMHRSAVPEDLPHDWTELPRKSNDVRDRIGQAFENSKAIPGHLEGLFKNRNSGSGGSKFKEPQTAESLINADWKPFSHSALMKGTTGFVASVPGFLGITPLKDIPDNQEVTLDDGHKTGFLSVVISGKQSIPVNHTVLILGDEGGKEVVYTFHPGDPIRPSSLPIGNFQKGQKITAGEAKKLGFEYAKLAS